MAMDTEMKHISMATPKFAWFLCAMMVLALSTSMEPDCAASELTRADTEASMQLQMDKTAVVDADGAAFPPAQGRGGILAATDGPELCNDNFYHPSKLERLFQAHANDWTNNVDTLCQHLAWQDWDRENLAGEPIAGPMFSRVCRKGQPLQVIEPLAGILRDPNFICAGKEDVLKFGINWLVLADKNVKWLHPDSKRLLFDAGGSRFNEAMHFFVRKYQERGIVFDHIYVWEATKQGIDDYWQDVPHDIQAFWKKRLTFYNGVPVTADKLDMVNNPVNRIHRHCSPKDFCAFKLDIDTPEVEAPLVQQLLASPERTRSSLDEFFFEHHVHGLMESEGWGGSVTGTFADSYQIFARLRELGVRAHSWI